MLGPTLLQPGIGRVLDQRWAGAMANGVRVYSVDAFQAAFAMIVAWSLSDMPAHRAHPGDTLPAGRVTRGKIRRDGVA